MQALLEFLPLVAFLGAYYAADLYTATAVLMVSMVALLAVDWLRGRRIPPMHGVSALLVFIFGAATLILHDQRFIQWKPTIFFWLVSLAFLGSLEGVDIEAGSVIQGGQGFTLGYPSPGIPDAGASPAKRSF